MRLRDPYQQALSALVGFAGEGRFVPGMPLVIASLAEELGLSPTPVREALARLAGEGVVEHWPGRGYFAPGLAASDIVELYGYHQRLVLWAMDLPGTGPAGRQGLAGEVPGDRVERVFASMAERPGNRVLLRAYRLAAARLRPIRHVEALVAPVDLGDVERLEGLLGENGGTGAGEVVARYHEGRILVADSIANAMRQPGQSIV